VRFLEESVLREYVGAYQWEPNSFLYLQAWNEFSGFTKPVDLVAFDESGQIRVLYPTDYDRFFAGPGAAVSTSIESQVEFRRDAAGKISELTRQRKGAPSRVARRVDIERHEDVRFSNADVQLTGTLISPNNDAKHAAIILVHGSGPENWEYVLPFARFLIRHGMAVLAYDKRGVGGSTGDWNTASFDDLAGDVVAAFEYLKTRSDIDRDQIGLLGVSQAGWVMPLAAIRAGDLAFLISVSGAGVAGAETMLDHAGNEMTAAGMQPQMVAQLVGLIKLQLEFARTGEKWDEYMTTRERLGAGRSPETFPESPDHPYWHQLRAALYDPAPTLRQLQVPTLALFGELDNNILAEKNSAAWGRALKASGNRDYTLVILPNANHLQFEAKVGNNDEMASLQGFVPAYSKTIQEWLESRIRRWNTIARASGTSGGH
jgi:pimeloyl-ACP methyl ester carboxylesterase